MNEELQRLKKERTIHLIFSVIIGIIVLSRLQSGFVTTTWGTLINILAVYVLVDEVRKVLKSSKKIKELTKEDS